MNLVSIQFLEFCLVTLLICLIVPRRFKWIVLLIASMFFYSFVGILTLIVLIVASALVFLAANFIRKTSNKENKKRLLALSVFTIVLWVSYYKLMFIPGYGNSITISGLGISYVSFSMIGYLVDVYWDRDNPEKNFFRWLCFVFYFPKITQGPISKRNNLESLYGGGIEYRDVCYGIQRMVYGYFKKLVIAERCAMFTTGVFDDVESYSGSIILVATVLAALQLYCDFSGYMDIVVGLSQCLGVKLEENFDHPFFSKSAAEFWRRWHITLGGWFKDYIYTPVIMSKCVKKIGKWCRNKIGKKYGNALMKVIALLIVWILTGLWHGTGINYVLWGLIWGCIIISSLIFGGLYKKLIIILHIRTEALDWRVFQMLRTFAIYCVGILLVRSNNLMNFRTAIVKICNEFHMATLINGTIYEVGLGKLDFYILIWSLFLVLIVSIMQTKFSIREKVSELHAPTRWIIYALSISVVLLLGIYGDEYSLTGWEYANF